MFTAFISPSIYIYSDISEHPRHLKRNIPYSQAIRLKRTCSDEKKLSQRLNDYSNYFVASGYKRKNVNKQMKRVHSITQSSCLEKREKKTTTRIPFVLTYHSNLPPVGKIINDHWNILQTKPKLRRTYKERPLVAYRRPKSLRDLLVKAEFQWEKRQDVTLGSRPCGKCSWCRSMQNTKEFKSISKGKTFKILHSLNCKSKWIVYLAKCTRCNLQYCGKAETQMNVCFNNNRHHVKTKLKSCELTSHFIENPNHDIDRDLEITLIEQLRKTETMTEENKKELLKKREIFWQETLDVFTPNGLNKRKG